MCEVIYILSGVNLGSVSLQPIERALQSAPNDTLPCRREKIMEIARHVLLPSARSMFELMASTEALPFILLV